MIDGVHFAEHVVLAAAGVDTSSEKHPLSLREGATENAAACKELLADLIERGLNPKRTILVAVDTAKAQREGVLEVFGERALLHRCQAHKKRNVAEALPQRLRASVHSAMNQAYATAIPGAPASCSRISRGGWSQTHTGAAASLREALEETLTVMRLGLPRSLERVLSPTNLIENLFSRVREVARWSNARKEA